MDKLFPFIAGAAIGAGLALLFAPQSGKETRAKIRQLAESQGMKLSEADWDKFIDAVINKMKKDGNTATTTGTV